MEMKQCSGQEIDPHGKFDALSMEELKEATQTNFKWETAALEKADQ